MVSVSFTVVVHPVAKITTFLLASNSGLVHISLALRRGWLYRLQAVLNWKYRLSMFGENFGAIVLDDKADEPETNL